MLNRLFGSGDPENPNPDSEGPGATSGAQTPPSETGAAERVVTEERDSAERGSEHNGEVATQALEWRAPILTRVDDDTSIPTLLQQRVERDPRSPLVEVKQRMTGTWRSMTAGQFWEQAQTIAEGLIGMGLEFGDRIAIMSRTRYEWMLLDFASWAAGLVPVPIYETSSKAQITHILKDADVSLVITETVIMANLVQAAEEELERSIPILSLDQGALNTIETAASSVQRKDVTARTNRLTGDSVATIVYTSGTTGSPKGTVLTHRNFTESNQNSHLWMPEVADHPKSRMLMFLPLAHTFARFLQVYQVTGDGVIGHSPDIKNMLADFASFRPSYLLVVPRVLEKIYNSADAQTGAGAKNRMFRWAANVAVQYSKALDTEEGPSRQLKTQHHLASILVFSKLTQLVGGNADFIISGGAPLSERLAHFYRGAGLPVQEGYGLTETTGPVSVNTPQLTKIGTVGPPLPPTMVRISDEGEVLLKGPSVFKEYHNRPDLTEEAFTEDGWFKTGDLGSLDKDGYLRVTGRAKEVIVTAGGKNVIPSLLEDPLRGHPLISNVVVVGDGRPFVAALITLDGDMLPVWLKNKGLPNMTAYEAAQNPEVRASLSQAIDRANEGVSRAESIRKFEILQTDFTEANGLLTPSMKVKRREVLRKHASDVDAIYGAKQG